MSESHRDGAWRARYVTHATRQGCSAGAVRLADVLAGFAARRQAAWPSQIWLAARLHADQRTVRRWTTELEHAGVLHVERHRPHNGPGGRWRRRTNRYRCRFAFEKRSTRPPAPDRRPPTGRDRPAYAPFGEPGHHRARPATQARASGPPELPPPDQETAMWYPPKCFEDGCDRTRPEGRTRCDECQARVDAKALDWREIRDRYAQEQGRT